MNYLSKENVQEVAALSLLQEAWFEGAADRIGEHYLQGVYSLPGNWDGDLLDRAWQAVIAASPELRTVFRAPKNKMVKVVLKQRPVELEIVEVGGDRQEHWDSLQQEVCQQHRAPFAVGEGPLLRAALLRGSERAQWILTAHPLILDDRSLSLVVADLKQAYQSLSDGHAAQLDHPSLSDWGDWVAGQNWTPAAAFWKEMLSGFEAPTPVLEVVRAQASGERTIRSTGNVSRAISQSLEGLAERCGVSKEAVWQAAWAILLQWYSSEEAVTFGLTRSGRPQELDLSDRMMGRLQVELPFRLAVDGDQTVGDFLNKLQSDLTQLSSFDFLPENMVRSQTGIGKDTVLYESLLAVHGDGEQPLLIATSGAEAMRLDAWLNDMWTWQLSGDGRRVAAPTIESVNQHLATLLTSLAEAAPETRLHELNALPAAERARMTEDFNHTTLPLPALDRLAHQVIEDRVAERPDAIACRYEGAHLTYRELNERANQLAHWLREKGVGRDDRVGVFGERNMDMLVGILAVLKAGGAYVPLDPAHPDSRVATVLGSSQPRVILTQSPLADRAAELAAQMEQPAAVFILDSQDCSNYPVDNPPFINEPGDLANVFFTSGSTGLPKGAMIEHVGMLNHLYAKINLTNLNQNSTMVQNASHCFDISVWQFLAPLMVGAQVVIYPNQVAMDPQELHKRVKQDGVTVLQMVPTMIDMILSMTEDLADESRALPDLTFMVSTGEGLPAALLRKWLRVFPHVTVINAYGSTETSDDTSHSVFSGPYAEEKNYVPLGFPVQNFKVYLLDRWNRLAPVGGVGEICVTGLGVGRGYLNDPERTAKAFVKNPFPDGMGERMYRTGDLGRYTSEGELTYIGRVDHQVKVRGHRIELREIEAILLKQPGVNQAVAVTKPDDSGQNRLLAYVTGEVDPEVLRDALHQYLPEYMIPEHLMVLESMPLNSNGKVDRKQLPEPTLSNAGNAEYVAPETELEKALCTLWEEVLERSPIGLDDNFFELGGHSIKTIQVRARLQSQLGLSVDLKVLFAHPTVRELVPVLEAMDTAQGKESVQLLRLEPRDHYPMSHAQRRMFFAYQMNPEDCTYNVPLVVDVTGALDVEILQRAFQTIHERHDTLRTKFALVDGQPVQVVQPTVAFNVRTDDVSQMSESEQNEFLAGVQAAEISTPFDLLNGPLFRCRVIKRSASNWQLWLNIHHIISDFWSWQVLMTEFTQLYEAYAAGQPNPLAPLQVQFTDYAVWEHEREVRGDLQETEAYWLQQLSGELPQLDLPTDFVRPAIQSTAAGVVRGELDLKLAERVQQLVNRYDTTPFIVLLTSFSTLMHRLSGQHDLIIGTPEAGRNRLEVEPMVGCFLNMLPLRIQFGESPTFLDMLQQVHQTSVDAFSNNEYPFDQLVQRVQPVRDLSRAPIFSVLFQVMQAEYSASLQVGDLVMQPVTHEYNTTKFDILLNVTVQQDGRIEYVFEYCSDLFERSTIERWIKHWEVLLEGIVEQPEQRIASLPMMTEEQLAQVLAFHGPFEEMDRLESCVHQLIEEQVASTPDAIAVVYAGQSMTYRELDERANQVANALKARGVRPGDLVGLSVYRSLNIPIGLLGILKAGAAYVPLDPDFPIERLQIMIEDASMFAVVTETALLSGFADLPAALLALDDAEGEILTSSTTAPSTEMTSEHPMYVLYTSGSTGKPKGVVISHRNVVNLLKSFVGPLEITTEDVMLSVTTMSFDIFCLELFLPLISGARVVLAKRSDAVDGVALAAVIDEAEATVMQATPAGWRILVNSGWQGRKGLKMLSGGEKMPPELAEQLMERGGMLWNAWGPTEITIYGTADRVSPGGPITIGRPLAGYTTYVLDEQMQPVPIGVHGEAWVGGEGVGIGYLNRPELTAERFVADPFTGGRMYKTGDLCRWLPDGRLEFAGRLDFQIKLRGYRIEAGDIEAALVEHPSVRQAVAVLREAEGIPRLVAYVVPIVADEHPSAVELREHLADKLPEYMIPSAFVVMNELPLTPNYKIDRKALPMPEEYHNATLTGYVAPRDQLEREIAEIWQSILHVTQVGIHDSFFELGGDSLSALVAVNEMKAKTGYPIPVALLFQHQTVEALCEVLRGEVRPPSSIVVPMQAGDEDRPPLFLVHTQAGGVMEYGHLVALLDRRETIYGIQAIGFDTDEQPLDSISAMADLYVEEIRKVRPHGPYRLAGWSFAGLIVFEMAKRLEEAGETVDLAAIFDTQPFGGPEQPVLTYSLEEALRFFAIFIGMEDLGFLDEGASVADRLERILAFGKQNGNFPEGLTLEALDKRLELFVHNGNVLGRYRWEHNVKSDLQLFLVSELSKTGHTFVDPKGWEERTQGSVQVYQVAGDHNEMCQPPHVQVLAEAMTAAIAKADADRSNQGQQANA